MVNLSVLVSMLCAGCMGFLYANATSATQALLGIMLREKLHQLQLREEKFYNDQRVLNEQLLRVSPCSIVGQQPYVSCRICTDFTAGPMGLCTHCIQMHVLTCLNHLLATAAFTQGSNMDELVASFTNNLF